MLGMDRQHSLSRRTVLARLAAGGVSAAMATAALGNSTRAYAAVQQGGEPLARQDVSLDQAQTAIDAAIAEAEARNTRMNIAVIDAGTNLTAFARMDGAWLGSVDIALKKARTAALFQMPSGVLGPLVQPGQPLYGAEISNEGLITFPGGVPLVTTDGTVIGAIGVSGSTVEDDLAVAEAGAAAIGGLATPVS